jgi:acylphosphatase
MKKVIVRAFDDGRIEIEASGYKGKTCKEATEFLEKILGKTASIEYKPEWWIRNGKQVRTTREKVGIKTDTLCG